MSTALVSLLEHSSVCVDDRCNRGHACKEMKQLIHHLLLCKLTNCKICMEVNEYVQAHSANCSVAVCSVITCNAWRQYAASCKKSTLSSYSSDCQALDSLRMKSKSHQGLQPKVRGTYLCGKCRMPKIRPHKCSEDAICTSTTACVPALEVREKEEEIYDFSKKMTITPPVYCSDPSDSVFTFHSRRSQNRSSTLSRSSSLDIEASNNKQQPSIAMSMHSRSMDTFDLSKLRWDNQQQPRPPLSPAGSVTAMMGTMISRSLDSSLSLISSEGAEQVISLVKKSSPFGSDRSFHSFPNMPHTLDSPLATASHHGQDDDSVASTTTSNSATSIKKRLLSPKSADSNRCRQDASKPRLAALPVEPLPSCSSPPYSSSYHYYDAAAAVVTLPTTGSVEGDTTMRGSTETAVPEYHHYQHNSATSTTTSSGASSLQSSYSSSSSDLSGDASAWSFSPSSSATASDNEEESIPSLLDRDTQPMMGFAGYASPALPPTLPPAFPQWSSGGVFPNNLHQPIVFYPSTDASGRAILLPCWIPPVHRNLDQHEHSSASLSLTNTITSTALVTATGGGSGGNGGGSGSDVKRQQRKERRHKKSISPETYMENYTEHRKKVSHRQHRVHVKSRNMCVRDMPEAVVPCTVINSTAAVDSGSAATVVAIGHVVSPAKPTRQEQQEQQEQLQMRKSSKKSAITTSASTDTLSEYGLDQRNNTTTSATLHTLQTLDTLLSSDLDVDLSGEMDGDDLNMELDVFTLALDELSMPARQYCDEDEEDIFKFLNEEIVL